MILLDVFDLTFHSIIPRFLNNNDGIIFEIARSDLK